jgi:hypothetical protein
MGWRGVVIPLPPHEGGPLTGGDTTIVRSDHAAATVGAGGRSGCSSGADGGASEPARFSQGDGPTPFRRLPHIASVVLMARQRSRRRGSVVTSAGWYKDPTGHSLRYRDGARRTERKARTPVSQVDRTLAGFVNTHRRPIAAVVLGTGLVMAPIARVWPWIVLVVPVVGVVACAMSALPRVNTQRNSPSHAS